MTTSTLTRPWLSISLMGTSQVNTHSERRSLILANQMGSVLLVLCMVLLIACFALIPGNTVVISWLSILCAALFLSLVLNHFGKYRFTQLFLGTGLPLILILSTVHSKLHHPLLIHEGSYYNPRYFLLGLSVLPFVVFEPKDIYLRVSAALNLFMLIGYPWIHQLLGASPEQIGVKVADMSFAVVASSSAGLALVAAMAFFKQANARYESRIRDLLQIADTRNQETEAAIRYARKLQETIIPFSARTGRVQNNLAVFSRARDIVSGDFPFMAEVNGLNYYAVCDCTGHGVPGAFISLIAHNRLLSVVNEFGHLGPAAVLDQVHKQLILDLRKNHSEVPDGMDLALCLVDPAKREIRYASARGIAYLTGKDAPVRLESERRSICDELSEKFNEFRIPYEPGDRLMLCSDGFQDQFGGPAYKKFGRRRLEELMQDLNGVGPESISYLIGRSFDEWRQHSGQTDDVAVMCVYLS